MTKHPITPLSELTQEWSCDCPLTDPFDRELYIATKAARWGADQELEACVQHVRDHQWGFVGRSDGTKVHTAVDLQLARRPKPPSLKEQALEALDSFEGFTGSLEEVDIIRRALEALPDE